MTQCRMVRLAMQALLSNMESMFASPDLQLPSCDVRDVARAHILAAEIPTAKGRRATVHEPAVARHIEQQCISLNTSVVCRHSPCKHATHKQAAVCICHACWLRAHAGTSSASRM